MPRIPQNVLTYTGTSSGSVTMPGALPLGVGTYVITVNAPFTVLIDLAGGGQSGESQNSGDGGGESGGGAGSSKLNSILLQPGKTYNLTVGPGGIAPATGKADGGDSVFLNATDGITLIWVGGGRNTGGHATTGANLVVGGAAVAAGGGTAPGNPGLCNANGAGSGGSGTGYAGGAADPGGTGGGSVGTTGPGGAGGLSSDGLSFVGQNGAAASGNGGTGGTNPNFSGGGGGGGGAGALLYGGFPAGGGGGGAGSRGRFGGEVNTLGGNGGPGVFSLNGTAVGATNITFPNCITPDAYPRHNYRTEWRRRNLYDMFSHPTMVVPPAVPPSAIRRIHINVTYTDMKRINVHFPDSV